MKLYEAVNKAMNAEEKERVNQLMLIALEALAQETDYRLHKELMSNLTTLYLKTSQELVKTLEKVERLANTDHLTQIYNRVFFSQVVAYELDKQSRITLPLSLMILDIDHFKNVNDTFGHDVGDAVLKGVSSLVNNNIRKTDTLARWGGEEFVILMPNTTLENAILVAENLRVLIEQTSMPPVVKLTCSFGLTQYVDEDDIGCFVKRADEALYTAKQTGRNRVCSNL